MTICVSKPPTDSFTGHAKNVTFLQLTDLITDSLTMENSEIKMFLKKLKLKRNL